MKFSEMPYTRPDIDALLAQCRQLAAKAAAAPPGSESCWIHALLCAVCHRGGRLCCPPRYSLFKEDS